LTGKFSLQFWLLLVVTITSVPLFVVYAEKNDLDNDGIPDDKDHCPHLPEDYLDEIDGCPSEHQIPHDSDSDGIDDNYDVEFQRKLLLLLLRMLSKQEISCLSGSKNYRR